MAPQNFKNHTRYVPMFHFVLLTIILIVDVLALLHLYYSFEEGDRMLLPVMFFLIAIALFIGFFSMRNFPLRAQDRAIRAEENLRHFVLTGKLLDKGLTMSQIIALRFAEDEEFLDLAVKSRKENMSRNDIKKAIKNWKADNHRA